MTSGACRTRERPSAFERTPGARRGQASGERPRRIRCVQE
jgi:hypothetical protein